MCLLGQLFDFRQMPALECTMRHGGNAGELGQTETGIEMRASCNLFLLDRQFLSLRDEQWRDAAS